MDEEKGIVEYCGLIVVSLIATGLLGIDIVWTIPIMIGIVWFTTICSYRP